MSDQIPAVSSQLPAVAGPDTLSPLGSVTSFGEAVKMAKYLSTSELIPAAFRGKPENVVIALELAHRIGASCMAVMQSLYIVHGKPGFSAAFLVATLNATRRFSPLRYQLEGEGDARSCYCYARDVATGETVTGPRMTIAIAKAEGWYSRNGSKWKTMPDLMLSYRAATLFVRLFAPEISLGLRSEDELADMGAEAIDVTPQRIAPEDFGVVSRSAAAGKAPPASDIIVDEQGRTIDRRTGEVIERTENDAEASDSQGAQEAAQGAPAAKSDEPPAEPAREAPAQARAAEATKAGEVRPGPTPKSEPASPEGDEPIGDLSPGMQRTLVRKATEARVTIAQVEAGIGKPISRANLNDALGWIEHNGAR